MSYTQPEKKLSHNISHEEFILKSSKTFAKIFAAKRHQSQNGLKNNNDLSISNLNLLLYTPDLLPEEELRDVHVHTRQLCLLINSKNKSPSLEKRILT